MSFRPRWGAALVCAWALTGCVSNQARGLLVVAPHPDDEVLMAAGLIARAQDRGDKVTVVVLTNGDYDCDASGWVRPGETVSGLHDLGVAEDQVHFLGYPDGHLSALGPAPLAPVRRLDSQGVCRVGDTTYASRGAALKDEHTARTGAPGLYTSSALVDDLAAIIQRSRPREIVVSHPLDDHPDHARTYAYLRRSLDQLQRQGVRAPEGGWTLKRAMVHAGACWPQGSTLHGPCPLPPLCLDTPLPPLPEPFEAYSPPERVPLSASLGSLDVTSNLKVRAITRHRSQTGPHPLDNWLMSFARSDEAFFPERLLPDECAPGRLGRAAPTARAVLSIDGPVSAPRRQRASPEKQSVRFDLTCPQSAEATLLVAPGGLDLRWELRLLPNPPRFELRHAASTTGHSSQRRWQTFPLPLSWTPHEHAEPFELWIDPREDEGVTELSLFHAADLLGVGIVPEPPERPESPTAADAPPSLVRGDGTCSLRVLEARTCKRDGEHQGHR